MVGNIIFFINLFLAVIIGSQQKSMHFTKLRDSIHIQKYGTNLTKSG